MKPIVIDLTCNSFKRLTIDLLYDIDSSDNQYAENNLKIYKRNDRKRNHNLQKVQRKIMYNKKDFIKRKYESPDTIVAKSLGY